MKSLIVCSVVGLMAVTAFAKPFSSNKPYKDLTEEEKKVRLAEAKENRLRLWGDKIVKPGSQQGKILFIDAKANELSEDYAKVIASLSIQGKYDVSFAKDEGEAVTPENVLTKMEKAKAQIVVFVVNCPKCMNMIIAAPDNGWAIVNSAAVKAGASNTTFERARLRKALVRGYLIAAGAPYSRYPGALMSPVTKPADLDKLSELPPVDVVARCKDALENRGVTPEVSMFYRKACQEGWAPAPTNEYQKAIWDKVHALPTKPIKILPETKKVTE